MTDKEAIETMKHWIDFEKENKEKINKADELIEVQETILNLIQTQQEDIEDYQRILDTFDKREYRKRYLEEERAKRPKLLYPDADEIYQRYYEQKAEIEKKNKIIDEMTKTIYDYASLEVAINCPAVYDGHFNMDLCKMNLAERNCIKCLKEHL